MLIPLLIALVAGYLLGSLPFGYLVARGKGVDIFAVGSRNPGATNVRRVLGNGPGNLVLFLDALKGAVAAGWPSLYFRLADSARSSGVSVDGGAARDWVDWMAIGGLVGALVGHSFSCFTGFRGGKGVATGAGGFAVVFPSGAGIALLVWLLTLALTRYVSLASMLAALSLPLSAWYFKAPPVLAGASVLVALFVVVRHRANVSRLLAGTESKIGRNAAAPKS